MLDQPMTSKMIAEKDGVIGHLIFNNPARHNAVSLDMWQAVGQIIDDFERDDAVRVIVVSGAGGRAFVSGADISEFKERRASEEAAAAYSRISEGARMRLQETLKPTIAMIRGYCIGGGVGTALACDMRIAAEGSKFGVPAAKLGLGYAYDGIKKLVVRSVRPMPARSSIPRASSAPRKRCAWAWSIRWCQLNRSKAMSKIIAE